MRPYQLVALAACAAGCVVPSSPPPEQPRYSGPPGEYGEEGEPGQAGDEAGPDGEWGPEGPEEARPDGAAGPEGEAGPDELDGEPAPEGDIGAAPERESDPGAEAASAPDQRGAALSTYEAAVAAAVNRVRRDPPGYVAALERHRRNYQDNYLYLPGVDAPILTVEGVRAVDEAIRAARRARPSPPVRVSPGLSRAARAHASEIGRAGTVEHQGRDGRQPHQRMERFGRVVGLSGENIGTGWGDGTFMVMSLFIDDGVVGRGHRVNLLEPEYRVLGVGCAAHKRFGTVCVLDFAADFRE